MSTYISTPLRIATIGLSEQMTNALRLFFQGPCQNDCVLAPEESAELSIVDLDGYNGKQRLENHLKTFPQRPVIVLSLHEKALDGTIFVRKPIKPTQLFDAIKQVKIQLRLDAEKSAQELASKDTIIETVTINKSTADYTPEERSNIEKQLPAADLKSAAIQGTAIKQSAQSIHRVAQYLDERSVNTYIGSAPDIDPENQRQVANTQYDPENFFQSYLNRAIYTAEDKGCSVFVECPQGSVTISPKSTRVLMNISEQKLHTLSTVPVIEGSVSLSLLKSHDQAAENHDSHGVDSEGLMWKTALWASRGRVPVGTNFRTPVMMRRWPNLTKLLVFPHALRVAALWAKGPYSLVDTAKFLDIPQRYVFAFYSAAHAIGLVTIAEGDIASPIESKPSVSHGRQGLLDRIVDRLRWR